MSEFSDISEAELDGLIGRVSEAVEHDLALSSDDLRLLLSALVTLAHLQQRLADSDITLHKLRKLAGIVSSSEKFKDIVPGAAQKPKKTKKPKPKKSKADVEPVVHQRCKHPIEELAKGSKCPECERGTLYKYEPATFLRISGQTPLISTQHILERLRCNSCGEYFTAKVPEEVEQDGQAEQQRYGYSARALMVIQKYFAGAPFYRQQTLQQLFRMPVTASTVFDQCEHVANAVQPVVQCLIKQAANAVHYYLDDTTNRILNQGMVMKADRKTGQPKPRSGIYTSGIIATLETGQQCVLFQTNIGHAGEWIDEVLSSRSAQAPPLIMSDALNRNFPAHLAEYHQTLCNSHARREFVEVASHFPDQVPWVLEHYGKIWEHEAHCKEQTLSTEQRLIYHCEHSLPVMESICQWGQQRLDSEEVEANSGLGKAINYFLAHYDGLTAFCRIKGAQLDNNPMEAMLKLIIRSRKNAMFYKTLAGAAIGDVLTSLIATCQQAGVNAFEYLIVLQRHAEAVKQLPQAWLPWCYAETLQGFDKAA